MAAKSINNGINGGIKAWHGAISESISIIYRHLKTASANGGGHIIARNGESMKQ